VRDQRKEIVMVIGLWKEWLTADLVSLGNWPGNCEHWDSG